MTAEEAVRPGPQSRYRDNLPQLAGATCLTDGGLETTLIFHGGWDLPLFAAFTLLASEAGVDAIRQYYRTYAALAHRQGVGLVLESPTWRASADWGVKLGYSQSALADANCDAIRLLEEIRSEFDAGTTPVVISGCLGPRGDGYVVGSTMSAAEASEYHRPQVETLQTTSADMLCALTLTYADEAIGIADAAQGSGMPVAISFTVETNGRLPSGQSLGEAIALVDSATDGYVAYYMVNCAHPTHFADTLTGGGSWVSRVRGLRANASRMSHAELNDASDLDDGDPVELGSQFSELHRALPHLAVLGGCCGTDHRHVEQIATACRMNRRS